MNTLKKIILSFFLLSFFQVAFNRNIESPSLLSDDNSNIANVQNEDARLVFYNVENLFDIYDDTIKNDDEFISGGIRSWDKFKFRKKINNIYKTLISVGEWDAPEIIGLCEIENYFVLEKLINSTPLKKINYNIIHYESPDKRGIDVAMLYDSKKITPLFSSPIKIRFPFNEELKTRDILYVKALIFETDTLHLFINHWPSRYGGLMETKPKRNFVATVLRQKVDSILSTSSKANIIIMGDFNDDPEDESLSKYLRLSIKINDKKKNNLVNLMLKTSKDNSSGSLKYKEKWNNFDQIIVSENLLNNSNDLKVDNNRAIIFNDDFLLEKDEKYMGVRPFRTYSGYKYKGGFSDHLPVYIDLVKIRND